VIDRDNRFSKLSLVVKKEGIRRKLNIVEKYKLLHLDLPCEFQKHSF
jgi:hypothetical protein